MRYDAAIVSEAGRFAAIVREISGLTSRQVAGQDRVTSRLYVAVLDRDVRLSTGRPVRIERGDERLVAYPVFQDGRTVRLHCRDGEFYPGLVLETLGGCEYGRPGVLTGGDGWFVATAVPNVFRTLDFTGYDEIPSLRGRAFGAVTVAGPRLVLGGLEEVAWSADGLAWTVAALPEGSGEVVAMAWDGARVLAACSGGLASIDPATGTVESLATGDYRGLSERFNNPTPYRARSVAGAYAIETSTGAPFRTLETAVPLAHNWVAFGEDAGGDRFVFTGSDGVVTAFGRSAVVATGAIEAGDWPARPATFVLGGIVLALAFGRLAWTDATALHPVYDFGGPVTAWPGRSGPVIARDDGLVFRVRRAGLF